MTFYRTSQQQRKFPEIFSQFPEIYRHIILNRNQDFFEEYNNLFEFAISSGGEIEKIVEKDNLQDFKINPNSHFSENHSPLNMDLQNFKINSNSHFVRGNFPGFTSL